MKGVDVVLFTCHIVFWMYASSRSGVTWCDANFSRCSINVRYPSIDTPHYNECVIAQVCPAKAPAFDEYVGSGTNITALQ